MLFLHRYALELGWPVPLLKRVLSCRDISEAMAFERYEPFKSFKDDYRHAVLCYVIATSNGAKKVKVDDFMPRFNESMKPKDSELVRDIKEAFNVGNTS